MPESLAGGSIRILWEESDSADVTITGTGAVAFTVNGSAVTFPYNLTASTTFATTDSGRYIVSVKHHGVEIAGTPDGTRNVELSFGAQHVFSPTPDGSRTSGILSAISSNFVPAAKASSWPMYCYGNSYGAFAGWHTSGQHYLQRAKTALGASSLTSYAVGGQRIIHTLCALVSAAPLASSISSTFVAGSAWPGTSSRSGLVVLETLGNDIGHYPSMTASPVVPATITSANNKYLDGITGMYRAALALLSSQSRVEQSAGTFTGTWTNQAFSNAGASGGTFAFTSTAGAAVEFSVTPPQRGPLAGKVYALVFKHSTELVAAGMATINVQVDGGTATPVTPTAWERHTGIGGLNLDTVWDCIPVTVPIDGNAHTVKLTHAGGASTRMDVDCLIIPSEDPNPIAVMGHERAPEAHASTFNAAGCSAFRYNTPLVQGRVKTVVAEFSNAFWVCSTMTSNGLYSGDKLHPNDRGMAQRANDLTVAAQAIRPRLESRGLSLAPDAAFGVV